MMSSTLHGLYRRLHRLEATLPPPRIPLTGELNMSLLTTLQLKRLVPILHRMKVSALSDGAVEHSLSLLPDMELDELEVLASIAAGKHAPLSDEEYASLVRDWERGRPGIAREAFRANVPLKVYL